MDNRKILYLPSVKKGNGTGHLVRCLNWSFESTQSYVYLPREFLETVDLKIFPLLREALDKGKILSSLEGSWDLTVLDRRSTALEEYKQLSLSGISVALDETGAVRDFLPYIIDILPETHRKGRANIYSLGFLDLPGLSPRVGNPLYKVLLSFGGEDPAGLTSRLSNFLIEGNYFLPQEIHCVLGPLALKENQNLPKGVHLLSFGSHLKEHLGDFEWVFTSYGLTAFEALSSGSKVILFNPSPYHRRLSRNAGFREIGVQKPDGRALRRAMKREAEPRKVLLHHLGENKRSLDNFLRSLSLPGQTACPVCGSGENRVVIREERRSFCRCRDCGILYQISFIPPRSDYSREYFFREYRQQYGRTYLEDFNFIKGLGKKRLSRIKRIYPQKGDLLDLGCAYGPFLAVSAEEGFKPFGIDLSGEAVEYVRRELGFQALQGDFPELYKRGEIPLAKFDVVTLWFVIEHFPHLNQVLTIIPRLLKPGGVLAFSTPSYRGISGRKNLRNFCKHSPLDHYTLFSPGSAKRVLKKSGFKIKRIVVTGHHPERFPLLGDLRKGVLYGFMLLISRLFRLGDTLEVYAILPKKGTGFNKEREL